MPCHRSLSVCRTKPCDPLTAVIGLTIAGVFVLFGGFFILASLYDAVFTASPHDGGLGVVLFGALIVAVGAVIFNQAFEHL